MKQLFSDFFLGISMCLMRCFRSNVPVLTWWFAGFDGRFQLHRFTESLRILCLQSESIFTVWFQVFDGSRVLVAF